MNAKVMVRILFAALFIFTCLAFAGFVRAETTTQFVVEGENLVVRETEVVRVKQFLMPPNVDIPEKDLPKIYAILEQGKGDYVLGTAVVHEWQFGIPMKKITQTVDDVISLSNGTWLWHGVVSGAPKSETNWGLTLAMIGVIVATMVTTRVHQKSGKSEWWLLAFYGALIMAAGGTFGNADDGSSFIISLIATIVAVGISFNIIGVALSIATVGAMALPMVTLPFIGQQAESVMFMAFVIAGSYGGAKLAKYCRPKPPNTSTT